METAEGGLTNTHKKDVVSTVVHGGHTNIHLGENKSNFVLTLLRNNKINNKLS